MTDEREDMYSIFESEPSILEQVFDGVNPDEHDLEDALDPDEWYPEWEGPDEWYPGEDTIDQWEV